MKAYTDLEQSRKLAEILPLESADMGWNVFVDGTTRILPIDDWDLIKDGSGNVKFYHAWSLAALLNVLPKTINFGYENDSTFVLKPLGNGKYLADYYEVSFVKDNSIDACVELIEKLYEQKLL